MLTAYRAANGVLERLPEGASLKQALWIDLYQPEVAESIAVAALGIEVPTLEDMEEIEVSNRLYRERRAQVMTVVLPGVTGVPVPVSMPVSFVLTPERIVTVRHHRPRSFETYPLRADKSGPGCDRPPAIFLGLVEEIVGRLADILENIGRELDDVVRGIYRPGPRGATQATLQAALEGIGRAGDVVGKVRVSLMTLQRAVLFFSHGLTGEDLAELRPVADARERDISALEVHADFLASRVGLASDAAMGMINLAQNTTMRIVSVLTVLFLPPTLIASMYGMNFAVMPELNQPWGYPLAIGMMVGSALLTWGLFRWKGWL
ncbi:MAG: magnesium transporter CorA family protein [Paracoccaceae bacterium]